MSVIVALYNYEDHVIGALESLRRSQIAEWELVVVDDGSGDRSLERVKAWIAQHQDLAALLLRHPVNQGLGPTRNDALDWARGEFCFILDADNEIYPHCLARLIEALDRDAGAAFAYGIQERFTAGEPSGLQNVLAWEPRRLRVGNYIDAMAMIRTSVLREELGGYARDRRLHGLEDYDLLVPPRGPRPPRRVRARDRRSLPTPTPLDAVADEHFRNRGASLVIERSPRLMAGMAPPL